MNGPPPPARQLPNPGDLALLLAAGVTLYVVLSEVDPGLDGPSYLFAFALIWAFLMVLHTAARRLWRDDFAVSVVAAVVLAGVAFSRYRWGVDRGMQRWGFLLLMTILGCATFFIRVSQPHAGGADGRRDGRWSSTGCGAATGGCGASTGGGGCGG
jgi:uncharacterized membrane protein YgcG